MALPWLSQMHGEMDSMSCIEICDYGVAFYDFRGQIETRRHCLIAELSSSGHSR